MTSDWLKVLTPIIGLFVNIIIQIFAFKTIKKLGLLRSAYFGFGAGFINVFFFRQNIAIFLTNLIIYCGLGYCYFHFINLGETARRIRILRELCDSREGLSLDEILRAYNAKEILENRLQRLTANGQVFVKEGRYYIGRPLMLYIAKGVYFLKSIIFGGQVA